MRYFLLKNRHSCIQKLIIFVFIFLAYNCVLSKSNETGIFCSPVFAQSCSPALLGSYDVTGFERGLYVSGNTAYVVTGGAANQGNLYILNVTNPAGPVLLGSYGPTAEGNDVYVSGDTAYYAMKNGLYIIDVSNPAAPLELGFYDTPGPAKGVYVSGNVAYVADNGNGLQIVDVSNPAAPSLLGSFNTPAVKWARGVFVSDSKVYLAYGGSSSTNWEGGLHIIDVSNPAVPSALGRYVTPGYARGVYVSGSTAYVAAYSRDNQFLESGLYIIDVSNPTIPSLLGFYNTSRNAEGIYVSNSTAYLAVDWLGLDVIDVSNPTTPSLLGSYDTTTIGRPVDVIVSGSTAYMTAGSLLIMDIRCITIDNVWTSDIAGNPKRKFNPGDPIRYNVDLTFTGNPSQRYKIVASGKAKAKTGTFWETILTKKRKRKFSGSYTLSWDEVVPITADSGSKGKVNIKVKVKGIGTDKGKTTFRIR